MSVLARRAEEIGLTLQTAAASLAVSPRLEIVLWNEGAEALLGFTRNEMLGRRCFEVLGCPGDKRRLCIGCGDRWGCGPGEHVPTFEHEISTKSRERIPVSVTTLLAASSGGEPLRVHLLGELKRQRQLEELLRDVLSAASKLAPSAAPCEASGARAAPSLRGVTVREWEVVRLLAQGTSTPGIAAHLGITPRTARNHIQNVLSKLNVHSRLEAVAYASARGLL